ASRLHSRGFTERPPRGGYSSDRKLNASSGRFIASLASRPAPFLLGPGVSPTTRTFLNPAEPRRGKACFLPRLTRPWWRKRLGVEPSLPRKGAATDFEDREGHRAPAASVSDHSRRVMTRSVSDRSSRVTSAPASASSSLVCPPVATPIDRAPAAAA